jgi:hypothetical protein
LLIRRLAGLTALITVCGTFSGSALGQLETRAAFLLPGKAPYSATVGDFNRDGNLDLAVVSFVPTGTVSIMLGNGDGTFRAGPTYAVAVQPFIAAAASLRSNGILDLVVSDSLSEDVYVMLGNGDGTFEPPVSYPTSGKPFVVRVGSLASGGNLDIIALAEPADECDCVEVLPGNGDGTFGPAVVTPVPYGVDGLAMVTGHFTNSSTLDAAVTGQFGAANQVDVLGSGDGSFEPDGYYPVVLSPYSIAVGDFTGDGRADLAVADDPGVHVLLGNGNGTFQEPVLYPTNPPAWVVAEDLSGDGKLDLAVSNTHVGSAYLPGVSVLKGNGDGTFQPPDFYPAGKQGTSVAAGDFNGDGKPDLVLVDDAGDTVITLLNTGVASFSPTTPLNFKKQKHGTTSSPQTVTLTNTGKTELKISSMKASTQFGVTSTCGSSVAPGADCAISVTFSPKTQGAKSGTVTINDSASSKPQVIELSGTGT